MSRNGNIKRSQQSKRGGLDVTPIGKLRHVASSMVVYGPSGSGKTTFAATAPGPILYIDIKDRGTDSISDVKDIDVFRVDEFADFEEAYWALYEARGDREYDTVIIDTCTQLQTMVVEEKARPKKNKRAGDWGSMSRGDWGDVAALLKEWFGNYRDLTEYGYNVIFIAQDRTFNLTDEEESNEQMLAPEVGPALSPSVAKALNADVNIILNTFIRERTIKKEVKGKKVKRTVIEYCVGVGPSSIYRRKVRKPKSIELPDVIADAEFEDIIDIIKGKS